MVDNVWAWDRGRVDCKEGLELSELCQKVIEVPGQGGGPYKLEQHDNHQLFSAPNRLQPERVSQYNPEHNDPHLKAKALWQLAIDQLQGVSSMNRNNIFELVIKLCIKVQI